MFDYCSFASHFRYKVHTLTHRTTENRE